MVDNVAGWEARGAGGAGTTGFSTIGGVAVRAIVGSVEVGGRAAGPGGFKTTAGTSC